MNFKIPHTVPVSGEAIADLIRLADGDTALLYLYITASGGERTSAEISGDLNWSSERTRAALSKLISSALLPRAAASTLPRETELAEPLPAKPVSQMSGEMKAGKQFYSLVQEVQRVFGRVLSSDELVRLFGIYDTLKLSPEVILQLIGYCISETGGRDERPPSMKYIEKAAYTWEREGIFTLEQAEQYIVGRAEKKRESARIKKTLQINDRELAPSEKKYVDSWLALGFRAEAIAIAYDRTVTKTGKLAWSYMNSIINSWHGKGLYTAEDIMEKDRRSDRGFPPSRNARTDTQPDKEELLRINRMLESLDREKN